MIQLLPINDTTAMHSWMDSYPYAAISAFALHPVYLNLEKQFLRSIPQTIAEIRIRTFAPECITCSGLRSGYKDQVEHITEVYQEIKDNVFQTKESQLISNATNIGWYRMLLFVI